MAQQFTCNVYQFNSSNPIPLASVGQIGFPSAGVLIRRANDTSGNAGVLLSTGIRCYGLIQLAATGDQYYTEKTQAALVILANT